MNKRLSTLVTLVTLLIGLSSVLVCIVVLSRRVMTSHNQNTPFQQPETIEQSTPELCVYFEPPCHMTDFLNQTGGPLFDPLLNITQLESDLLGHYTDLGHHLEERVARSSCEHLRRAINTYIKVLYKGAIRANYDLTEFKKTRKALYVKYSIPKDKAKSGTSVSKNQQQGSEKKTSRPKTKKRRNGIDEMDIDDPFDDIIHSEQELAMES